MNDYGYYIPEYSTRKRTPPQPEFRYHVVSADSPHTLIAGFQAIGDAVEYVRNAGKSDRLIKVV